MSQSSSTPRGLSCPECGHSNRLNGAIVHGPKCSRRRQPDYLSEEIADDAERQFDADFGHAMGLDNGD
jgi:hypothetical protein